MPDYKFIGDVPRVMTGLVQGVNALSSNSGTPYGSTVVCHPGDSLHTDTPYVHAELVEIGDPYEPAFDESATLTPALAPITNDTGAAEQIMTAEGAPVPATEQEPA